MAGRFDGTETYIATEDLRVAVNAAIALERPLLVKGEPGTGKTILAHEIAKALGAPAHHLAHQIDDQGAAGALRVRRGGAPARRAARRRSACTTSATTSRAANCGRRSPPTRGPVLLIDEIDKADIEFPNDLLLELDRMEFYVYETRQTVVARQRPIVLITSNNEKELPDAFLRRCFFHYIRFPDRDTMARIVAVHHPGLKQALLQEALNVFYEIRDVPGLKKKPTRRRSSSTGSSCCWSRMSIPRCCVSATRRKLIPPLHGALLKNEQDVQLFERLAFLHRRERGGG